MRMDKQRSPSWDDNPLYKLGLLPRGHIGNESDTKNRLVWCIEYKSLKFESLLLKLRSTEMVLYQFWLFEHVLQKVMEQVSEKTTITWFR